MTQRIRRTPEQWQAIIERQANSGQSASRYCDTHQLSYAVFSKWRRKLALAEPAPLIDLSTLVMSPQVQRWDVELDLGGGVTLRMRRG